MKLIPLTQGKFAMVDDEDYDFLMEFKWHARRAPRTWYAKTNVGGGDTPRRPLTMHMLLAMGEQNVDHWDRNGLNNCKSNLRFSSLSQNHGNQAKTSSPTSSKYKGVCWRKDTRKWFAYVGTSGKNRIRLGQFTNEIEAARAYDRAALVMYGPFARINFPCQS